MKIVLSWERRGARVQDAGSFIFTGQTRMLAVTRKTWAKRAVLLGLFLLASGYLAVFVTMQSVFTTVASPDATSKARLLADAVKTAQRVAAVTRFTSPLGAVLFVGGLGTLVFLRLRDARTVRPSDEHDTDERRLR